MRTALNHPYFKNLIHTKIYFRKNMSLSLSEFKFIWWMEYLHRMWGRTIGAVFVLPASYFWYKGMFNKAMKIRVSIFASLIGFQVLIDIFSHFPRAEKFCMSSILSEPKKLICSEMRGLMLNLKLPCRSTNIT